jgi:hypothetical protein
MILSPREPRLLRWVVTSFYALYVPTLIRRYYSFVTYGGRRSHMAVKVTMLLTERDVQNVNEIHAWTQARTKAQAVSIALSLTRYLIEQRRKGATLLLRQTDGEIDRIVMTELENLNSETVAAEKRQRLK